MISELIEELGRTLNGEDKEPTAEGWRRSASPVTSESESIAARIRTHIFHPEDPTPREQEIIQALESLGVPVEAIFSAEGVPEEADCAQISRADVAEYLGAAMLHRADGIPGARIWGKNLEKLKCTHSQIGVDVVAVVLGDDSVSALGEDERLHLVSAKHSLAQDLRGPCREIVSEFGSLSEEGSVGKRQPLLASRC